MSIVYSVVIPLKNEENNIGSLIDELEPVMNSLGLSWELICVDDGSTDGTRNVLINLASRKTYLRNIFFKRNYGQSSAFDAGFKAASGQFVITLDGDGQNDPNDIPRLADLIGSCDMVCGIRTKRKDTILKQMTSKLANFVRSRMCNDGVQDTGCSLKIYRKEALDSIKMFNGMHRFLPALFTMSGFRIKQLLVNHRERLRGKSNYNFFNRSFNTVADLLAVRWMMKRTLRYEIELNDPSVKNRK